MRIISFSLVLLAPLAMASTLFALEQEKPRGRNPEMRQRMLEKFDKDGDGRLNEEERDAAHEFMQSRRGKRGDHEFRPGGPPGEEGWRSGKGQHGSKGNKSRRPGGSRDGGSRGGGPPNLDRLFDQFDRNDDGKLDREEFRSALQKMHEMRGRGKGRHGQGPPRGDRQFRPGSPERGPRFDRDGGERGFPGDRPPRRDSEFGGPPEGRGPRPGPPPGDKAAEDG